MSTPTLDQDAIASLFAAANEGALPSDSSSERAAPTVRAVDFRRPRQFVSEAQRKLRRALDTWCRTASSRLSAELRSAVDLEVISVDQLTWSDAHEQLPTSSLTAIVVQEPLGTRMLLSAEQPLLVAAIERMLGGTGEHPPPQRRLTDIDMMLAGQLFDMLIEQLSVVWNELLGATLAVDVVVSPQQSAQLAPTSEPTLAFTLEGKLLGSSMAIILLLPHRAIAPVADRLLARDDTVIDPQSSEALDRGIRQVRMEVRAEVGSVDLPIGEVLALTAGDLVNLHVHSSTGVTLYVGDTPIERAKPGRSGSRRAVQVLAPGELTR